MIFNFAILVSECLVPGVLGIGFRCFFPGASTMPPLRPAEKSRVLRVVSSATLARARFDESFSCPPVFLVLFRFAIPSGARMSRAAAFDRRMHC